MSFFSGLITASAGIASGTDQYDGGKNQHQRRARKGHVLFAYRRLDHPFFPNAFGGDFRTIISIPGQKSFPCCVKLAFGIFTLLTASIFYWIAKNQKTSSKTLKLTGKSNRFFLGMLMSTLNFFPVPYLCFCSHDFASFIPIFIIQPNSDFVVLYWRRCWVRLRYFLLLHQFFQKIESQNRFLFPQYEHQYRNHHSCVVATFMAVQHCLNWYY